MSQQIQGCLNCSEQLCFTDMPQKCHMVKDYEDCAITHTAYLLFCNK